MPNVRTVNLMIRLFSLIGLLISLYAYRVEQNLERDPSYTAMCDINESISCTKAFNSEYGKGFGILGLVVGQDYFLNQPNSVFGVAFYILCFSLSTSNHLLPSRILFMLTVVSNIISLYLAYLLYFVLHDLCIVCVTTYLVNLGLAIYSYNKLVLIYHSSDINSKKKVS